MNKVIYRDVDIAIIGGGPAGLGAAIKAKEQGAKSVLLIERSEELGGVLPQCIHNGFGLHYFKEELTGPEYAYKLVKKAETAGVEFLTRTMVIELNKDKVLTAISEDSVMEISAKAVVLCMGCRERSRGAIRLPGFRPAGIFTAGTAQRLINIDGYIPGKEIVILGSGDIGMIMARRLKLEGAEIKCIVELLPFIGGLIRNEVQCLHDFDIPVYTSHTVTEICGRDRLEKVIISKVAPDKTPIKESEKVMSCDTLLLSVGLIPENELSKMAGIKINPRTGGPFVDNLWQTSVPGIFAGGNVVHVHDLADHATQSSEDAALGAVRYIYEKKLLANDKTSIIPGHNIRYVVPNVIFKNTCVSFYIRVAWPYNNATIKIGNIYEKKFGFLRPSEQIRIDVSKEHLKDIGNELTISCEGEEVVF
ncbi:MAG: NAD(P)/FAD-dependent oxidoreductase [Tepidanaerobacteraceae bacterium]|jgi:NADPH-dependent 2,4-dienoyl-CoA reductase/sulfur reductase-like enzyme